jgi:hypothetical protein
VPEQFFDPAPHLLAFRTQGLDFRGQMRIRVLRLGESGLRRGQLFQRGFLLLPQTVDERDCFLNAVLKVTEAVDFRFLSWGWHRLFLFGWGGESGFDLRRDGGELTGVGGRRFGKNLPVELNTGKLQTVHELAVGQTGFAGGGADADDPQRAEVALFALAADVSELQGALNGFLSGTVQLALG